MAEAEEEHSAKQLAAVRVAINEVDEQIVSLMSRRERNVRGYASKQGVDPSIVEQTYRAMIDAFIEYELQVRREQ